ncbi:hypothetical protein C8J56DRAFT_1104398 [Mycena floridula]|nr:hypothetical protein C8J56DRAFT_1104398 [Mycena floridula]
MLESSPKSWGIGALVLQSSLFSSAHSIDFADSRIKIVTAGKCGQSVGANSKHFCSKIDRGLDVWLRVHKVTLVFVAYWMLTTSSARIFYQRWLKCSQYVSVA